MTNTDTLTRSRSWYYTLLRIGKHGKRAPYTGTYKCQNLACDIEHDKPSAQCECGNQAYPF